MAHQLIAQGKSQTTPSPKQARIRTGNTGADPNKRS
jgi:hypothetical protein